MEKTVGKRDVYSIVTDRIIEKLEQGVVPWKQPWQDSGVAAEPDHQTTLPWH